MKHFNAKHLLAALILLLSPLTMLAQDPYALLSEDGTLTFYYDFQYSRRPGKSYLIPWQAGSFPGYTGRNGNSTITTVTFHPTFDNYHGLTSTSRMFQGLSALTTINDLKYLHTENVTDMSLMFCDCSSLTSLNLTTFDTKNVTNMKSMFNGCSSLTSLDLRTFDTEKVTDMSYMFSDCSKLTTIYADVAWSTANVTDGTSMFYGCTKLVGGEGTTYNSQNYGIAYARIDGGTRNPGYLSAHLEPYASLSTVNSVLTFYYDTHKTEKNGMDIGSFTSNFDVPWFFDNGTITTVVFDDSFANYHPTSTAYWFYGFKSFTTIQGIENLNTDQVTNMNHMFYNCSSLTSLDLRTFNTKKVTNMDYMFNGCSNLTTIYVSDNWSIENVSSGYATFLDCLNLVGGNGTAYSSSNTTALYARIDKTGQPGYLSVYVEPYAVLSGNRLTFYYDEKRDTRSGTKYDIPWRAGYYPGYTGRDGNPNITTVTFDSSFDNYHGLTSTSSMFQGLSALTTINNLRYLHTAKVTDMSYMFVGCSSLTSLDLTNFNTAKVTDMKSMFYGCSKLTNLNLTTFDTEEVTDMKSMFNGCSNLTSLDLTNFDTKKVTDMSSMFNGCSNLTSLDLTNFDTKKVTDMSSMFNGCSNLTTIYAGADWSTANVTNGTSMFYGCSNLKGGNGTAYDGRYTGITYARIDMPGQAGYLTDKNAVYAYAALSADKSTLTFYYDNQRSTRGTTYDLNSGANTPSWYSDGKYANVTKVVFAASFKDARPTSTYCWFDGMSSLTSISGMKENLNTSKVTDMRFMFRSCSNLTTIDVSGFNTANVKDMSYMFYMCSKLTSINASGFNTANVTDMSYMFCGCPGLTSLVVSGFNTSNVTNMNSMFRDCSSLTSLNVSTFNTGKVTNMLSMFHNCSKLTSLDLSNFNTANVTSMWGMFYGCSGLTSLDLTNFNTKKVTDMSSMFNGCSNLTTIYAGADWSTANVTEGTSMFSGCSNLKGGNGTAYSSANTTVLYARIDMPGQPGYLTDKNATTEAYAVLSADNTTLTFYYDTQRSTRGTTYDLNSGENIPGWYTDKTYKTVTTVVFDSSFKDARPTSTYYWFFGMSYLASITGMKENLNTSEVKNMYYMFYGCSMESLDVSGFNTANVENMTGMFAFCDCLESLDVSAFNTEKVATMSYMFAGCSALTSLDLSGFNTEKVEIMNYMFTSCSALTTIYVGDDWSTELVTSGTYMFSNCTSLVGGSGTRFDAGYVDHARAHIDGGTSNPGYFTKFVLGDANGDGKVTITDAVAVVNYILNTTQGTFNFAAADVDGNGSITITDAVSIVNIILNSSSAGVKERSVREEIGLEKDPD